MTDKTNAGILLSKFREPLVTEHTLPITVKRFFTDVNGTLVDKALVPVSMQTKYPVYCLGEFDRRGGYRIGNSTVPPSNNVKYVFTYVHGVGLPFLAFTGLNSIQNQLRIGDIVTVYTDDLNAPNFFCFIVQQNDYASLASVVGNSETIQKDERLGKLRCREIIFDNSSQTILDQYREPLHFVQSDNLGTFLDNQVQPYMFKPPEQKLNDFIPVKVNFFIDQYLGINFNMVFTIDQLTFNMKLEKYVKQLPQS